jgi:uncharacterized membrane protein
VNTALLVVLLPILLALAGLAIDSGQALVVRREVQALADSAARAGAAELDEAVLRRDPFAAPALDPVLAADAALDYVTEVQPAATATVVEVDPSHIKVRVVSPPVRLTLLQLAGVGPVRLEATARSEPRIGIIAADE